MIKDVVCWLIHCQLGKFLAIVPLRWLLPLVSFAGKIMSARKHSGLKYFEKVRKLLPGVDNNVGRRFAAYRLPLFCERMKYPDFIEESGLEGFYEVQGLENLDAALSEGKGVVMAAAHFGAMESGFLYLARLGYKPHLVRAISEENAKVTTPSLERKIRKFRMELIQRTKMSTIFYRPDKSFAHIFTKVLKCNEILMILPEGGNGKRFIDVPFLNGTLRLATGFAFMSFTTGAPIIPIYCVRIDRGYRLIIEAPIYTTGKLQEAVKNATEHFGATIERYFKTFPDQWLLLEHLQMSPLENGGWHLQTPTPTTDKYYDMENYLE